MEKKQASSMDVDPKTQNLLKNLAGTTSENQPIPSDEAEDFEANEHSSESDSSDEGSSSPRLFPPGILFHPRDSELILNYLNPKIREEPLPGDAVWEVELYKHDPEEITGTKHKYWEDEWYFFAQRERKGDKVFKRETGYGTWRCVAREKKIEDTNGRLIGYKRPLQYMSEGKKTEWLMTEYRTVEPQQPVNPQSDPKVETVVCRVYRSPRAGFTGIPDLNLPHPRKAKKPQSGRSPQAIVLQAAPPHHPASPGQQQAPGYLHQRP